MNKLKRVNSQVHLQTIDPDLIADAVLSAGEQRNSMFRVPLEYEYICSSKSPADCRQRHIRATLPRSSVLKLPGFLFPPALARMLGLFDFAANGASLYITCRNH